ncbi:MAG: asparagine synthase (glutamine-hydrolyzing) [Bacteroidetes bacterium]|nr:MAG: asparagine synthase (glutamine-hydrolyzing) [Bacteroidota bacterium]REK07239.1 MAG: asparagine synthase (glutamine-hydrolyzing) [Bacteroidota bacterium]REK31774.1 MAG: asparagine synthase (glutamine-hydrolyzing) [Bacteroidota bacterium]REK48046.1 MAG: asparagine synthase (glutamine-hydrolyzing) [Bacteroidota bacterium]
MCGINGIMSLGSHPVSEASDFIHKMNDRIRHRGPDGSGYWTDGSGKLHLGHLRLSILDLSDNGSQPMISRQGNVIVFNGEIYNFKELRERFFSDVTLRSESDTEIILLLYEKFGKDFLRHLNGMFAFAIWNPKEQSLFLARDPSGKKPIYYTNQNGVFAFSSEIKALLELPWVKRESDPESLYHFLTFNMLPPPLTMFRNIYKFHPAHAMIIRENGESDYYSYWEVEYSDKSVATESELCEAVFDGLKKSVSYRMVSDVPVGAFLSGGVDSSAVVAMMTEAASYPVKTYSVGFDGQPDYDELDYASKVSRLFNTEHYEKIVTPSEIADFLPRVVEIFDEPLADATCIPIYFISELARKHGTKVVLTGDGSDELFAGYRNWQKYIRMYPAFHRYSALPLTLKRVIRNVYGVYEEESPRYEILQRAARNEEFFWGGAKSFKESVKKRVLEPEFISNGKGFDSYSVIKSFREAFEVQKLNHTFLNDTDWMCWLGFKFIIPNFYLNRMDKLGMAHSVEIRNPFLDKNFVNLALSVPSRFKTKNDEPKYILKKALEEILPADILYRKKMGFCVPLREWAGEIISSQLHDNLKGFCEEHPQFNYGELRQLVTKLDKGEQGVTNRMWTLYFLISWYKKWMN